MRKIAGLHRNAIVLAAVFAAMVSPPIVAETDTTTVTADQVEVHRQTLWRHLLSALPPEAGNIDVYAENPKLTVVCLRAGGRTWLYSLHRNHLELIEHAQFLPPGAINAISYFAGDTPDGVFILWRDGQRQLTIPSTE